MTIIRYPVIRADRAVSGAGVYASDFGAVGNGTIDDGAALQAALNATPANSVLHLTQGNTYKITSALTWPTKVAIDGHGATIHQVTANANCLAAVDGVNLSLRDITIAGPVDSSPSGTGSGIVITRSVRPDTFRVSLQRVIVHSFGADGINASNLITSDFANVEVRNCGAYGFNIHGVNPTSAGTSVVFTATYANANIKAGYLIDTMAYCAFVGAAADGNGIGYELINAQGVSFTGCGAESQLDNSGTAAGYAGYSWKINGGYGITLDGCFTLAQPSICCWVTGTAQAVVVTGLMENSPTGTATACVQVDAGSSVTLVHISNTINNVLTGSTLTVNDGGGLSIPGYGYFAGPLIAGASLIPAVVTLTDAATVTTNAALGNHFRVSLGGNRTLGTPANPTDGQECTWELIASGAARTVSLTTGATGSFAFGTSITALTATTSAARDLLTCVYSADKARWLVARYVKGF